MRRGQRTFWSDNKEDRYIVSISYVSLDSEMKLVTERL